MRNYPKLEHSTTVSDCLICDTDPKEIVSSESYLSLRQFLAKLEGSPDLFELAISQDEFRLECADEKHQAKTWAVNYDKPLDCRISLADTREGTTDARSALGFLALNFLPSATENVRPAQARQI